MKKNNYLLEAGQKAGWRVNLEGKLESKLESQLEIAKKLLLENLPIDLVAKITELPKEQVEELI